jgi:uncharacterized membrane protein
VEHATLEAWIAEGRVKASDLVWSEGMADWAAAGTVFTAAQPGPPPAPEGMVYPPPPGGTGGQMPNGPITARARALLSGRWGLAIGFSLLMGLLLSACALVPIIGPLAQLILVGPLLLGQIIFFLTFVRRGEAELGMLFAGFKSFGRVLVVQLLLALISLAILFGSAIAGGFVCGLMLFLLGAGAGSAAQAITVMILVICLIAVPLQFWIALRYSQAYYLMADDANLGAIDAMRLSVQMMDGKKNKLCFLWLRFTGWYLLCLLTLGIGLIWLIPYIATSMACFYEDLRPLAAAGTEVSAMPPVEATDTPPAES